jgi:hypothetical protein
LKTQKQGDSPFDRKAPLMVILPGIFGSAFNENQLAKADDFYKNGYHVLILSNPWNSDLLQDGPQNKPGDIENEGQWVLEAIRQTLAHDLSVNNISTINLYGESYGAFLSAIATGLDNPNQPLVTGKVMLASPPLNLMSALHGLDSIADQTDPVAADCKKNEFKVGLNFMHAKTEADLTEYSISCAEYLVSMTFNGGLAAAMTDIQKTDLEVPRGPFDVRFSYYSAYFAPAQDVKCSTTDKCKLSYWIKQANLVKGGAVINIVAAKDDFLNAGVTGGWDNITPLLADPAKQLVLLNWGGHLGYVGTETYESSFYTN